MQLSKTKLGQRREIRGGNDNGQWPWPWRRGGGGRSVGHSAGVGGGETWPPVGGHGLLLPHHPQVTLTIALCVIVWGNARLARLIQT